MELGQIQKQWLADLRTYPERQLKSQLGTVQNDKIKACCLGQALLTLCEIEGIKPIFKNGILFDGEENFSSLENSYKELGLWNGYGRLVKPVYVEYYGYYHSLSEMNDNDVSWVEIADYIEKNPENVFTKSV